MGYPQAPWTLKGYAAQTLNLIDIDQARSHLPPELEIVPVLPGKTLGGVYLSHYGAGSALEYHELIVVSALARYGSNFGIWVSHIYVDNPDSVAGGREIWGLPKELAQFTWEKGTQSRVVVSQGDRTLCRFSYKPQAFTWHLPFSGAGLSASGSNLLLFGAELHSKLGLVSSSLEVPIGSPFAHFKLEQPWLTVCSEEMTLTIAAPKVIGKTTPREVAIL